MRSELFVVLKEVMKSRGLNYREISEELGMSESGFKKLMSNQDCSMSKLDEICDVLNISFADLVALSKEDKGGLSFNQKQEELFLKNPSFYHFLIELMNNDYKWEEVRLKHGLSKKKCIEMLAALDRVNLLRLEPGNKIKKIHEVNDISISAKLAELVAWDIDEAFFHHARSEFTAKKRSAFGKRGSYTLKKESIKELMKSIHEVTTEFAKRSKREEILYDKKDLEEVTLLAYLAQGFRSSDHIRF